MRGRKPVPNEIKKLRGNPGKRPIVQSGIQPEQPSDVLPPPAFLSKEAKAEWRRLAPQIHKLGLLTEQDLGAFAAYCQAYGRWAAAEAQLARDSRKRGAMAGGTIIKTVAGNVIQNPAVSIANAAMAQVVKYAVEFGFTPSARARVHNAAPEAARRKAAAEQSAEAAGGAQPAIEPKRERTYFN